MLINMIITVIWAFLLALGTLFVIVEMRAKNDKSFLYFGITLLLLCAFTSFDIWIFPVLGSLQRKLYWIRVQNIVALPLALFMVRYLMVLTGLGLEKIYKVLVFYSIILSIALMSEYLLLIEDGNIKMSISYIILFVPFSAISIYLILYMSFKKYRESIGKDKKIYGFHLLGFVFLVVFGFADLSVAYLWDNPKLPIPSFTIVGELFFGFVVSYIFTERFLQLIEEKQHVFEKLRNAYSEMENSNSLIELGKSTAIINHEIKNYIFGISGLVELMGMKEKLSPVGVKRIEHIKDGINRIKEFSDDVLNLSKVNVIRDKVPVDIGVVIKKCVESNFGQYIDSFTFNGIDSGKKIFGNWVKLEQVFVNIFDNSIYAANGNKPSIEISILENHDLILITIEDNGKGCTQEELKQIFKAFYTTKPNRKGTGLGMSVVKGIVASHGGSISAYSKNLQEGGDESGLVINISFPMYGKNVYEYYNKKQPVIFITDGIENIENIFKVFKNINFNPHVVKTPMDINKTQFISDNMSIIGSVNSIRKLISFPIKNRTCYIVSSYGDIVHIYKKGQESELFSEKYVVQNILTQV